MDLKGVVLRKIAMLIVAGLLIFASYNLMYGAMHLAGIDASLAIVALILIGWDRKYPFSNRTAGMLIVALAGIFFSYLICSGGYRSTGIYWAFLFPFLAFFLQGAWFGILWTVAFLLINISILTMMAFSGAALPLPEPILWRAGLVYLFVSVVAFFYEWMHYQQRHRMQLNHEQFAKLVENSYDLICVADPLGKLLYLSPAFEKMTGYSVESFIGKNAFPYIHPDDHEKIKGSLTKLALEHVEVEQQTYRFLCADGEWIELEAIGTACLGADGDVTIIVNVRDVGERFRMERQLRASEQKFSMLFHSAQDAIMIHDSNGSIIDVNPAAVRQFGYSDHEFRGTRTGDLVADKGNDALRTFLCSFDANEVRHSDVEFVRKDGSHFFGNVQGNSFELGGEPFKQCVIRDVTRQHDLTEQLQQSQKMESIGTLAGGIAHDFNNTLAAMKGNLYLARHEPDRPGALGQRLEKIEQLSDHATDTVRQLLAFARKSMVEMKDICLNESLQRFSSLAAGMVPDNIGFSVQNSDEQLHIRADQNQLMQVLMNLLSNACDAVSDVAEPVIQCTLESFIADAAFLEAHSRSGDIHFAHLIIEDNGCGIEEAVKHQIFDPFFTTKDVDQGAGLGLAMVYGTIHAHEGLIEVESRAGEGSVFHIYLPLLADADQGRVQADSSRASSEYSGADRGTILLVDDHEDLRSTTKRVLQSSGYRVLEAADGKAAVDLFRNHAESITCLVSDIVMPHVSGIEAARMMREIESDLPVILVTGYDRDDLLIDELPAGCEILSKPFSIPKLLKVITRLTKPAEG